MDETELIEACEKFVAGWPHFLKCIDFNHSHLDAEAIRFFNEVPAQIKIVLDRQARQKKGD